MYRITPYRSTIKSNNLLDLFDDFFGEKRMNSNFRIDVRDFEKEYLIEAELPGFTKDELSIHYENEHLTIEALKDVKNEKDNDTYLHRERYYQNYKRQLYLKDVDPKKLKAKFENGILSITALKLESSVNKYMVKID